MAKDTDSGGFGEGPGWAMAPLSLGYRPKS